MWKLLRTKSAEHRALMKWYFGERPKQRDPLILREDLLDLANRERDRVGKKALTKAEARNEFFAAILQEEGPLSIELGRSGDYRPILLDGDDSKRLVFSLLRIQPTGHSVVIRNADIWILDITENRGVQLIDCRIGELRLVNSSLDLIDCWVARLNIPTVLHSPSIRSLRVEGGGIASIGECPQPSAKQPIDGDVIFNNVYFGRHPGLFITGAQAHRNLRHHLTQLHNMPAANAVHSAELSIERHKQSTSHQIISYFYEFVCDSGGSVQRPLIIWFGMLMLCGIGLFVSDGAIELHPEAFAGWQTALVGECCFARALRTTVLALQSAASPLSALTKPLVIARSPLIAFLLMFYSTLSVLIVAMFLISVRRTFRMN